MGLFDFLYQKQEQVEVVTNPYQGIAEGIFESCGAPIEKALLYAEVEDGVISADVFFQQADGNTVKFRFASEALRNRVCEFWVSGDSHIAPKSWAALLFLVEGGRFSADLMYPDQLNSKEDISDRRPRVIAKYFPGLEVDYSKPHS
jgi:hypothetical protein